MTTDNTAQPNREPDAIVRLEIVVKCDGIAHIGQEIVDKPLTDKEHDILQALGEAEGIMIRGKGLAGLAGYPFNSNYRRSLSWLKSRALIANGGQGYTITEKGLSALSGTL